MASGPITSWEIDGETVETVSDFIFLGSKITADGDCSHEIIAVWAEQRYLSSCTHQALCQTPRGLAGPPEAQSPAELLRTNLGLGARQRERRLQPWEGAMKVLGKGEV